MHVLAGFFRGSGCWKGWVGWANGDVGVWEGRGGLVVFGYCEREAKVE